MRKQRPWRVIFFIFLSAFVPNLIKYWEYYIKTVQINSEVTFSLLMTTEMKQNAVYNLVVSAGLIMAFMFLMDLFTSCVNFQMERILYSVLVFFIPSMVLTLLNAKILHTAFYRNDMLPVGSKHRQASRQKRSIFMLLAIIFLFYLCHTG